jgi:hypothetical protein
MYSYIAWSGERWLMRRGESSIAGGTEDHGHTPQPTFFWKGFRTDSPFYNRHGNSNATVTINSYKFINREVSHLCENDNDNEHVITLWVRVSKSWRHLAPFRSDVTSSWRSKRTWFCWFASTCGHFRHANEMSFDYLNKNWWRVRYRYRQYSYWCETSLYWCIHDVAITWYADKPS